MTEEKREEILQGIQLRVGLKDTQLRDLSVLLCSTCGPICINALIENGFKNVNDRKRKSKKPKNKVRSN